MQFAFTPYQERIIQYVQIVRPGEGILLVNAARGADDMVRRKGSTFALAYGCSYRQQVEFFSLNMRQSRTIGDDFASTYGLNGYLLYQRDRSIGVKYNVRDAQGVPTERIGTARFLSGVRVDLFGHNLSAGRLYVVDDVGFYTQDIIVDIARSLDNPNPPACIALLTSQRVMSAEEWVDFRATFARWTIVDLNGADPNLQQPLSNVPTN